MAAFALILSFVESRIPAFVAIPGVKMGLANIAVIFTLYTLGIGEAVSIAAVKVLLSGILFGTPVSIIYSLAGAFLSLIGMIVLKKLTPLAVTTVSIVGAILHNIGQISAAIVILGTEEIIYYLPPLLISGTLAGIAVGAASALIIKRSGDLIGSK